jgi:hypothetical protein
MEPEFLAEGRDGDWSHDGSRIAFVRPDDEGLWVIQSDGSGLFQLVPGRIRGTKWADGDESLVYLEGLEDGTSAFRIIDVDSRISRIVTFADRVGIPRPVAAEQLRFDPMVHAPACDTTMTYDRIVADGRTVGLAMYAGCSTNEKRMRSLSVIDSVYSKPGTEVTVVRGEEDGGTSKPTVERHVQTGIRATAGPVPYSEGARTAYRPG